ncbi:lipopolysaccharide assembly protein LapA domain-containing protein [Mesobacillus subterraneus]|uniref:LapA family protein n=1 Tax=Mesobacillus subterraneus TaxID=285983 RepID=UPI001CFC7EBF|nr:lipopolysaccharide assembly protein LapA domain-containing protein [Mesobacillus subterraneus]WLR56224.1 lipopolysaccharide assembly protein LapA domain-containing protein [Mesobacillus subterraneus]
MKFQWTLLLGLAFALIVAVFAVINVDPVTVNYLFGESEWPLILVILGSVLMGGLIVGSVGLFRMFVLQREVKTLKKRNNSLEAQLAQEDTIKKETAHEQQIEDIH